MLPKRVLIFSLTYSPFIGGAEIAVDEITKRIAHADMHFDLVTMRADASLPAVQTINNVTVYRVGLGKRGISFAELSAFPWYLIKVLYVPLAVLKARSLSRSRPYNAYW